ncbi:MAG: M14 family metallocarboxypeptidase [Bacteroidota bacterium]
MAPLRRGTYALIVFAMVAFATPWYGLQDRSPMAKSVIDPNKAYASAVCREDLAELAGIHPKLIEVRAIGRSVFGRDLQLASMGTGKKKILIIGSTHGREWMTSMLLMRMIETYAQASRGSTKVGTYDVARILSQVTMLFVPMLDPDGVDISLSGLEAGGDAKLLLRANLGRRDFSSWKANARGVNLNMQFQANWSKAISLDAPHYEKYKGPAPESEPESRALADLVRKEKPDVVLAYHATGRVIYWYYYQTGAAYRRDQALAIQLGRLTGYPPAVENKYNRHGGLKDWFILAFQRPAFTIEIGKKTDARALPLSAFETIWKENGTTPLYVAAWLTSAH